MRRTTLNRVELIKEIALGADISNEKGEHALNAILGNIEKSLLNGQSVQITGFGTFAIKSRAARVGRNPKTGQALEIAASESVKFTPGKGFKEYLNALPE